MIGPRRALAWTLVVALAGWALVPQPAPRTVSTGLRLLGPLAPLAAEVQWLRFQAARSEGEVPRALELAESALALDPRANEGWEALATHLAFDLASREREPDLARRRTWFQAGLAVLARGAEQAARPAELELLRGLVLASKAEGDAELDPGGRPALLRAAAAAFERAADLGDARARELAAQMRTAAAE